jgi:hypothetical protein
LGASPALLSPEKRERATQASDDDADFSVPPLLSRCFPADIPLFSLLLMRCYFG